MKTKVDFAATMPRPDGSVTWTWSHYQGKVWYTWHSDSGGQVTGGSFAEG